MIFRIKNHIEFLVFYTKAKLEAESFRHHAGYLWWILDPLFSVAVYYFLFKVILNRGGPDYIQFLFIGLVSWKWFADTTLKSSGSLLSNLNIIKKIKIKKHVFPIVEVFYNTWKFLVIFAFILIIYSLIGYKVSLNHFFLPVVLLSQFTFLIGCALFLASIIPFLPDLHFLITYSIRLLFYPSGVIFALDSVPEKYKTLVMLNPMAGLIDSYRNIVMKASTPDFSPIFFGFLIGGCLALIGLFVMNKKDKEYPKLS